MILSPRVLFTSLGNVRKRQKPGVGPYARCHQETLEISTRDTGHNEAQGSSLLTRLPKVFTRGTLRGILTDRGALTTTRGIADKLPVYRSSGVDGGMRHSTSL